MMLKEPNTVLDFLGFDAMSDPLDAVTGALHGATSILTGKLGTDFDRVTGADLFYIESAGFTSATAQVSEFRLGRGFIDSITSYEYAALQANLGTSEAVSGLSTIVLKKEKGVVLDATSKLEGMFLNITWVAGFEVSADPDVYDLSQVPQWLQDAAQLQALISLANHPSLDNSNVKLDTRLLTQQLSAIISHRIRYTPAAILPL